MIAAERIAIPRSVGFGRRLKNRIFSVFLWSCALIALTPLVVITLFVIGRGISALSVNFFTKTPAGPLDPSAGGISEAFIGTLLIVGMACLISIPLGMLTAVYLAEYAKGRMGSAIRFVCQILLSTPSIIAGLVVAAFIVTRMHTFSALAGSIAISVLMWPVIARAGEEVLRLVPQEVREGALALGLPRWKVVLRIVVPSAGAGILTAIMLAVARGLGETAPLLLTVLGSDYINTNPIKPTDAVPLRIYQYARQPIAELQHLAWGAAVILMAGVLILSIAARILSSRQQKRIG